MGRVVQLQIAQVSGVFERVQASFRKPPESADIQNFETVIGTMV
jgi:hypothetical protein